VRLSLHCCHTFVHLLADPFELFVTYYKEPSLIHSLVQMFVFNMNSDEKYV